MRFERHKGVSVIIATLLLIAIAVAAGIVVYIFVNGLAGNLTTGGGAQTTERLQMQSYNFQIAGGSCACVQQIIQIFLLNSGSTTTTISAVYYDGNLLTLSAAPTANTAIANNVAYTTTSAALIQDFTASTCTATAGSAQFLCFTVAGPKTTYNVGDVGQLAVTFTSAVTAGTTHTVKVVSTTGATYVFSVISGRSG